MSTWLICEAKLTFTKEKLVELMESEYPKRLSTNYKHNISKKDIIVNYAKQLGCTRG